MAFEKIYKLLKNGTQNRMDGLSDKNKTYNTSTNCRNKTLKYITIKTIHICVWY